METYKAIETMAAGTGESLSGISRELGTRRNYINNILYRKLDVQAGTLARIASACGYRLLLVPDNIPVLGDVIEIDARQ